MSLETKYRHIMEIQGAKQVEAALKKLNALMTQYEARAKASLTAQRKLHQGLRKGFFDPESPTARGLKGQIGMARGEMAKLTPEIEKAGRAWEGATAKQKRYMTGQEKVIGTSQRMHDALAGLSWKMRAFGRVLFWAGFNMMLLVGIMVNGMRRVIDVYSDTEEYVMNVAVAFRLAGQEMNDAIDSAKSLAESSWEMGRTFGYTAEETAKITSMLVSAGFEYEEVQQLMGYAAMFARGNMTDLANTTEEIVHWIYQFNMSAVDIIDVLDILTVAQYHTIASIDDLRSGLGYALTSMQQFGIATEEGVALITLLTNTGIGASVAGRRLQATLENIVEHSKKLGFTIYDASGNLLSFHEILIKLKTRLAAFGTEAQRNAYLTSIFGQRQLDAISKMLQLVDITGEGEDKLEDLTRALEESGDATEKASEVAMESFRAQLDIIIAQLTQWAFIMGQEIAPVIDDIIKFLLEFIGASDFSEATATLKEFSSAFATGLVPGMRAGAKIIKIYTIWIDLGYEVAKMWGYSGSKAQWYGSVMGRALGMMIMLGPTMLIAGQSMEIFSGLAMTGAKSIRLAGFALGFWNYKGKQSIPIMQRMKLAFRSLGRAIMAHPIIFLALIILYLLWRLGLLDDALRILSDAFGYVAERAGPVVTIFEYLAKGIRWLVWLLTGHSLVPSLEKLAKVLGLVLIAASPVYLVFKNINTIINAISTALDIIIAGLTIYASTITSVFEDIVSALETFANILGPIIEGLLDLLDKLLGILNDIKDVLGKLPSTGMVKSVEDLNTVVKRLDLRPFEKMQTLTGGMIGGVGAKGPTSYNVNVDISLSDLHVTSELDIGEMGALLGTEAADQIIRRLGVVVR